MNSDQTLDKINHFPRWHYQFELRGHKTPIFQADHINRHEQRRNYLFRPLMELLGGSLAGKRVLDLGCNAGFWSLCAIESGCNYVLGIDGRQMHIDQAEFVFDAKGIDRSRYDFHCGNVFDLLDKDLGTFDIVLCLGLMYHISKPISLLERISAVNTDLLLIDTLLCDRRGSALEVRHESLDEPRNAIDYQLVLVPTRAGVLDMVRQFGYGAVVLRPSFTDYTGAADYRDGSRRGFLCAKRTELTPLEVYSDPLTAGETTHVGVRDLNSLEIPANGPLSALAAKTLRGLRRVLKPVKHP